ncbi:MAG: glycosyltransferase [Gloeotrichia echinulata GP01]
MHVLTILCQGGWMPTNLSEGWRRLGCSVEEFFYGTHMGKSWTSEGLRANHQINTQLLTTAKRLKAEGRLDLIFAVIYDDVLEVETAKQLRALDVPMVNYHVDLVGQWYRVIRTGKYFDRIACAQKDSWSGLRLAGIHPYYMPMAANPPACKQQATVTSIPFDGLLYLGSPWLYRRQTLAELAKQGIPLRIYGHNWLRTTTDPANAQPLAKNLHDIRYYMLPRLREEKVERLWEVIQSRLKPIPPPGISNDLPRDCIKGAYAKDDFVPLLKGAAINLGFTHFLGTPGTSAERRQVRLREFEIPMHSGFYLTQDCPQLREFFQVGENVATWDNFSDLLQKIRYYLEHPTERLKIAEAAQAHCLQHHTWAKRFSDLLQELNLPQPKLPQEINV